MARALVNRTAAPPTPSSERGPDGRLVGDLNDNKSALMSGSVPVIDRSFYNENLTAYSLIPTLINYPPYFETSVYNASEPIVKPIQFNDENRDILYVDDTGTIKVAAGSTFILRCKAQQPPIYNVENGKLTLLYDTVVPFDAARSTISENINQRQLVSGSADGRVYLEDDLTYAWFLDNTPLEGVVTDTVNRTTEVRLVEQGRAIFIKNITPFLAGTYYCEISNDIGTITTEEITIEVYNPDIENKFYVNLIENSSGESGIEGWSSPDTEFISAKLSTAPFTEFTKPWNIDVFGYSLDMFYPRPYHLNTYHIKNNRFEQNLANNGSYFTREDFIYIAKDGKKIVQAEYDVDLTDIQEYIQGSIFGIAGVRAIFGCYIGNAISKFIHTVIAASKKRRNQIYTVDTSQPRASLINCLIAGAPIIDEKIKVIVTEYDNETPLKTRRMINPDTGQEVIEYGIVIEDAWSNYIDERYKSIWFNGETVNLVPEPLPSGFVSKGNTREEIIIEGIYRMFPSINQIPTHGQYVKWNREIISKLNYRTNKIRVQVQFEITGCIEETDTSLLDASDRPFEQWSWQNIIKPLWLPQNRDAELKVAGEPLPFYINNRLESVSAEGSDEVSALDYLPLHPSPRALATGFNLILFPIERRRPLKTKYYTKTILERQQSVSYPTLQNSLTDTTSADMLAFITSIQAYTGSIIAIEATNTYNVPKKILPTNNSYYVGTDANNPTYQALENLKAYSDVPTKLSIATYKFRKNNDITSEVPVRNITRLFDQGLGEVRDWEAAAVAPELIVVGTMGSTYQGVMSGQLPQNAIGGDETPFILYNPNAVSTREISIPQIIDQLQSSLVKFVDNPIITNIPSGFVLEPMNMSISDYIKNVGINLQLKYEPYGENPKSSVGQINPVTRFQAWKQKKLTKFVSQTGAEFDEIPTVDVRYNFFTNVADNNINYYSPRQIMMYSDRLLAESNVNTNPLYKKKTQYNVYNNEYATVDNLASAPYTEWKVDASEAVEEALRNVGYALKGRESNLLTSPLTSIDGTILTQQDGFSGMEYTNYVQNEVEDIGPGPNHIKKYKGVSDLDNIKVERVITGYVNSLGLPVSYQIGQQGNVLGTQTYTPIYETRTNVVSLKQQAYNNAVAKLEQDYGLTGKGGIAQEGYAVGTKNFKLDDVQVTYYKNGEVMSNPPVAVVEENSGIIANAEDFEGVTVQCTLTITACAGNWSRVALEGLSTLGNKLTPAAIVYPKAKKIYYFIYNYIDNYEQE